MPFVYLGCLLLTVSIGATELAAYNFFNQQVISSVNETMSQFAKKNMLDDTPKSKSEIKKDETEFNFSKASKDLSW